MSETATHFAIFKWKEGAPVDALEKLFEEQEARILSEVPGIRSFTWGRNRSPFAKGYSHALLVIADDQAAIDRYRASDLRARTRPLFHEWREHDISADFGKL